MPVTKRLVVEKLLRGICAMSLAWLAASPALAQVSRTCEFALTGWLSTEIERLGARSAYRACVATQRTACVSEQGRSRNLQERSKLFRNYVERYCRR